MTTVAIIDNGGGNVASVRFALERLGVRSVVTEDAAQIASAGHVILPGVGAAPEGMRRLGAAGLDRLIPALRQPVLGICLGMQLLCEGSEEGSTTCLGIFTGTVTRLRPASDRPVPHMGWNQIDACRTSPLLAGIGPGEYAYFVHSYALPVSAETVAATDYGGSFAALVSRGNFHGVQWHPERSAATGARLLANFLSLGRLTVELIPAIDLRGGRCVRLVRGDFAAETRYPVAPEALYDRYAALGARHLHVVDLDGARDGVPSHIEAIEALARLGRLRLQVGGGLRTREALERMLKNGVARVVLGSLAVTDPALVTGWLSEFGPESIVLAFDVRLDAGGTPRIATHGWARQSPLPLWDAVGGFIAAGLRHVLCTDVERDGALTGPNTGLYAQAVERFPAIAWQASGGIRDTADLRSLAAAGATAAVSGRALLEERLGASELQPFLPAA